METPVPEPEWEPETTAILTRTLRHLAIVGLLFLGVLIFFLVSSGSAAADTRVDSDITTDTAWTQAMSPIWVESSISIQNGATLTIDPGVDVRFNGFYALTVQEGSLVADGDTAGAGAITFTSNFTDPAPGDWSGIVFNSAGSSVLDDVVIEFARTGITYNGVSVDLTNGVIRDADWYGIFLSGTASPLYDLSFTGCTIQNVGFYGVYVSSQFDTDITLRIAGCTLSSYGSAGLRLNTLDDASFVLTLDGNSFNASNRAVYFGGDVEGNLAEGDVFRFTFTNNWVNSSLDAYAIYMPFFIDFRDFQEVTVDISGNAFLGRTSRFYGVFLDAPYNGEAAADQRFTLRLTGNEFTDFIVYGAFLDQVLDVRNVTLEISGNLFQNTDTIVMDYGVYIARAPDYALDTEDSNLVIRVDGNTARDLDDTAVYFSIGGTDGYRTVDVSVSSNDVRNTRGTAYMDYGVYLRDFRFNDASLDSSFTLVVDGNTIQDLSLYGVYLSSSVSGFRTTALQVSGNVFENVDTTAMDVGVYFAGSISYTTAYDGSVTLAVTGNAIGNLSSRGVHMPSVFSFTGATVTVQGNSFVGTPYGFYMVGGVDGALDLSFAFTDNVATDMGTVLYADGFTGPGLSSARTTFTLARNTVTDSVSGLTLGTVSDYGLTNAVVVENNALTNLMGTAVSLGRFHDQTTQVDIRSNTIEMVSTGIAVTNPAYDGGATRLNIHSNEVREVTDFGIAIQEVYRAAAFIDIRGNAITASSDAFFSASLISFAQGPSGWDRALADIDIVDNVLEGGLHAIFVHGTDGTGATVLLDIVGVTAVDNAFGLNLEEPVEHSADIMNVRVRASTFRNNHRAFLFIGQAGFGSLPINITGTQVLDFGAWGGYAVEMRTNFAAALQIDVWSSTFQAASGSLGDVYGGSGPATMNFHFIDTIRTGVSNDGRQVIRTLWTVDVQVLVGKNFDHPARFGVKVSAVDQFGVRSFTAVTDEDGMVRDKKISGIVITNDGGTSAVHTLRADWGEYNGTVAASFTSNGTATIYLPGDKDADGIADHMDPDENPDYNEFFDPRIAAYTLQLWVLVGLAGAVLIPLGIWIIRSQPLGNGSGKGGEEPPEPPEEYGGAP